MTCNHHMIEWVVRGSKLLFCNACDKETIEQFKTLLDRISPEEKIRLLSDLGKDDYTFTSFSPAHIMKRLGIIT